MLKARLKRDANVVLCGRQRCSGRFGQVWLGTAPRMSGQVGLLMPPGWLKRADGVYELPPNAARRYERGDQPTTRRLPEFASVPAHLRHLKLDPRGPVDLPLDAICPRCGFKNHIGEELGAALDRPRTA